MSTGAVIAIVVVIVVVIALVAIVAMEMRRRRLRQQFGPEYDRLVTELGSRRKAEAELSARQRRIAKLDIRPLTREENARYLGEWNAIRTADERLTHRMSRPGRLRHGAGHSRVRALPGRPSLRPEPSSPPVKLVFRDELAGHQIFR